MVTPPIQTERLLLRNMTQADADNVWSIWGDREAGKYLADPYYETPEVLRELFVDVDEWPDYSFVAFLKDTSEFIGTCSVGPEGAENEWGFGYCVAMAHWGHGYATEMAKAMMDLVYQRGVRDFHCTVAVENVASARVMEKCGLQVDHESSFEKRGTGVVYRSYVYRGHLE